MELEIRIQANTNVTNQGRNIVICCDGTGNQFGEQNSNVVKLYQTLVVNETQRGYYHPGVGTMGAPNAHGHLEKEWTRAKGLAFGAGFTANLSDAYRYLMNTYRRGDKVFLFGFSRGAYTARALASVLHTCGLLSRGNEGLILYMMRMFARASRNRAKGSRTLAVAHDFKKAFARDVLIDFVGVWDTVSSIGWIYDPVVLVDDGRNPIVRVGRQAVSIDERRCLYHDKLWGPPFQPCEPEYRVPQDIKQVWFAGVHSDVGGSYPEEQSGLSKLALEWMLREAVQFGLKIDRRRARTILHGLASPNPTAPLHNSLKGAWWLLEYLPQRYFDKLTKTEKWRIPVGVSRSIPEGSLIHESVLERMQLAGDYRPLNLPSQFGVEPRVLFPGRAHSRPLAKPIHA